MDAGRLPLQPQADWAYFLDVDGTLLEIAHAPEAVHVEPHLLAMLDRLYLATDGAMALVSGRSVADLDRLFAPHRWPAAGLHGYERRRADGSLVQTDGEPAHIEAMTAALRAEVQAVAAGRPGVRLEDKGPALAIHYRSAPALGSALTDELRSLVARYPAFALLEGKMVLEVRFADAHKGAAVEAFMAEAPFAGRLPVFVGDDVTDEDGFQAVNRRDGLSLFVGPAERQTAARWRLSSVTEARAWLARVTDT